MNVGGSGGGGGGNLSGTLTPPLLPYANGVHTLADTALSWNNGTGVLSAGASIFIDTMGGEITTEFLHVTSTAVIDGLLSPNGGIAVNTDKFTVDGPTGNTVVKGTSDLKDQATFEKSTILGRSTLVDAVGVVTIDAYLSDFYEYSLITLGVTFAAPVNPARGRRFLIRFATTGVATVITWDPIFRFDSGPPAINGAISAYWYVGFMYNERSNTWDNIGLLTGPFA